MLYFLNIRIKILYIYINKRKETETTQENGQEFAKEMIPKPMNNGRKNNEEIEKLSKPQQ